MSRAPLGLLARVAPLGVLVACSSTPVLNTTNNFERAGAVDFVCLDVTAGVSAAMAVHPVADCGLNASDNGPTNSALHLHALVTQVARGEVAVVDLAATSGSSLIDNNAVVPGYTFIPVGAFPSALVVDQRPAGQPSSVWVASAAERAIRRFDAASVRLANARQGMTSVDVNGGPRDIAVGRVTVDGATRYRLYATVPDRNAIAVFDVTDPTRVMPLGNVPVTVPPSGGGGDAGLDAGGGDGGTGGPVRPVAIALDGERVLVSDERSPFVHVFEGSPPTEQRLLDVGAPTSALLVTPEVRARTTGCDAADPDHCAAARYLYAVAAGSGEVLVYDLTRDARVSANRLPGTDSKIDVGLASRWAVPFATPATALTLIDTTPRPENDVCATAAMGSCPSGASGSPGYLRGLFVGATLRNGRLTVIDLDDYDARCRESNCSSSGGTTVQEAGNYRFVRHAPRSSTVLERPPRLAARPTLTRVVSDDGQRQPVGDALDNPALACGATRQMSEGCTEMANYGVELTRAPGATSGNADPYLARNEGWTLTFEGVLPGLDLNGGGFLVRDDALVVSAPGAAFCARGVIADPPSPAARNQDLVQIVGDPTPGGDSDAGARARCDLLFGSGSSVRGRDFVIDAAYQDQLVIRPDGMPVVQVLEPGSTTPTSRAVTPEDVRDCFRQATRFQVRARRQWVAVGSRSGYQHAGREGAGGRCEENPAARVTNDALAARCLLDRVPLATRPARTCPVSRACMGTFDNATGLDTASAPVFATPYYCLQVLPGEAVAPGMPSRVVAPLRDQQFAFTITGAFEPYRVEAGTFPRAARFVATDRAAPNPIHTLNRLYVVDTGSTGLIEFRTQPVERVRVFN